MLIESAKAKTAQEIAEIRADSITDTRKNRRNSRHESNETQTRHYVGSCRQ